MDERICLLGGNGSAKSGNVLGPTDADRASPELRRLVCVDERRFTAAPYTADVPRPTAGIAVGQLAIVPTGRARCVMLALIPDRVASANTECLASGRI